MQTGWVDRQQSIRFYSEPSKGISFWRMDALIFFMGKRPCRNYVLPKWLELEIGRLPTVVRGEIDYQIDLYSKGKTIAPPQMYVCNEGVFYYVDISPNDITFTN